MEETPDGQQPTWRERIAAHPVTQRALHTIYTTPIEVAIGAVGLCTAFTTVAYNHYEKEARILPVAFSEVGKTIKRFEAEGQKVPPLTKVLSNANDVYAKIAESSNFANELGGGTRKFASELEQRLDPALRIHRQLPEYTKEIGDDARAALQSLDKFVKAAEALPPVIDALRRSWDEHHNDVYKTEFYTETTCDAKNNCTTQLKTRQVYDYTIHTYTYYPQHGAASVNMTAAFLQTHPDVNIAEKLVYATKTDPENEYAIEKSMRKALDGRIPTAAEALFYANTWATGSNFLKYQPVIVSNHAGLGEMSPVWANAAPRSRSTSYRTNFRTDPGPREFRIARQTLGHAEAIYHGSNKITGGIFAAAVGIPRIEKEARECVAVALDSKPGDADAACDKVLDSAKALYTANFENGLDVHPMKWGLVAAFGALGLVLGGLGGAGVDHLLNRRNPGNGYRRRRF